MALDSGKTFVLLLVCCCCIVTSCCANFTPTDDVIAKSNEPGSSHLTRAKFKLPKLFDFARFKQMFRKSYHAMEEIVRNKIFMARAFQVFLAAIKYRLRKRTSYLAINQMSDWTPEELERMNMKTPMKIHSGHPEPEVIPDLTKEELERAFGEVGGENINKLVGEERTKRSADDIDQGEYNLEELKLSLGANEQIESNNPNYEPPNIRDTSLDELDSGNQDNKVKHAVGFVSSSGLVSGMLGSIKSNLISALTTSSKKVQTQASLPDEMFVDHRYTKSNCYNKPRNQGQCGSCWAFATMALYEWHYCMLTNKLPAFSEQYLVDCGDRINSEEYPELNGCDGGIPSYVSKFVDRYGLELRNNYPYVSKQNKCAYNLEDPRVAKKAGYVRMQKQELVKVSWDKIEHYLREAPLIMNFHTPKDFSFYGGGVDDAETCRHNTYHIMLIVGHGREDGKEFWLIRNSYSEKWGQSGHWKLNKEATKLCFAEQSAFRLKNVDLSKTSGDVYNIQQQQAHDYWLKYS